MTKLQENLKVTLIGFYLGVKGLEIQYIFKRIFKTIRVNPERAAMLLKRNGLINDYAGSGDQVIIEWEIDGVMRKAPWKLFLDRFLLAVEDGSRIAKQFELDVEAETRDTVWAKIVNRIGHGTSQFI